MFNSFFLSCFFLLSLSVYLNSIRDEMVWYCVFSNACNAVFCFEEKKDFGWKENIVASKQGEWSKRESRRLTIFMLYVRNVAIVVYFNDSVMWWWCGEPFFLPFDHFKFLNFTWMHNACKCRKPIHTCMVRNRDIEKENWALIFHGTHACVCSYIIKYTLLLHQCHAMPQQSHFECIHCKRHGRHQYHYSFHFISFYSTYVLVVCSICGWTYVARLDEIDRPFCLC